MASTVQNLCLRLALRVDPRAKSGDDFVASSPSAGQAAIGVTDGDRFTKQRLLDCYNEARFVLLQAMRSSMAQERLSKEISLSTIITNIVFTATGDSWKYTLPSDYVRFISLSGRYLNGSVVSTTFLPIVLLSIPEYAVVVEGQNPHYAQSATNRFVVESAGVLQSIRGVANTSYLSIVVGTGTVSNGAGGTTVTGVGTLFLSQISVGATISIGSESKIVSAIASDTSLTCAAITSANTGVVFYVTDYKLAYYGLTTWTLTNITNGTTTEVFNVEYEPILIEVAEAICNEQGVAEVGALAKKLLNLSNNRKAEV